MQTHQIQHNQGLTDNPYHFGYVITFEGADYIFYDVQELHIALFLKKSNIDKFREFLAVYATEVKKD